MLVFYSETNNLIKSYLIEIIDHLIGETKLSRVCQLTKNIDLEKSII